MRVILWRPACPSTTKVAEVCPKPLRELLEVGGIDQVVNPIIGMAISFCVRVYLESQLSWIHSQSVGGVINCVFERRVRCGEASGNSSSPILETNSQILHLYKLPNGNAFGQNYLYPKSLLSRSDSGCECCFMNYEGPCCS